MIKIVETHGRRGLFFHVYCYSDNNNNSTEYNITISTLLRRHRYTPTGKRDHRYSVFLQ